jgi:hypothetical protein
MARDREQRFPDAQTAEAALRGALAMLAPAAARLDAAVTLQ